MRKRKNKNYYTALSLALVLIVGIGLGVQHLVNGRAAKAAESATVQQPSGTNPTVSPGEELDTSSGNEERLARQQTAAAGDNEEMSGEELDTSSGNAESSNGDAERSASRPGVEAGEAQSGRGGAEADGPAQETPAARGGKTSTGRYPDDALLVVTRKGEVVVRHTAYSLSYNTEHHNPNWVAWTLTAQHADGNERRATEFLPDPDVEARHRVTTDDYKGSGYDRGHMCPAADNKWSAKAMTECFYMSNMCPQLHELNAGSWESLESACRRWARREGAIYIVSGPVYNKARRHKTIGRNLQVTVPNGFFKCVLSLRQGHEKAIGFYYANNDKKQPMQQVALPVDSIEAMTGFDFFPGLPKKLERQLESACNFSDWK